MTELFAPSLDEQIKAVEREIRMRQIVYPRRVADQKMSPNKAAYEIAAMEAVLATLRGVKGRE